MSEGGSGGGGPGGTHGLYIRKGREYACFPSPLIKCKNN